MPIGQRERARVCVCVYGRNLKTNRTKVKFAVSLKCQRGQYFSQNQSTYFVNKAYNFKEIVNKKKSNVLNKVIDEQICIIKMLQKEHEDCLTHPDSSVLQNFNK